MESQAAIINALTERLSVYETREASLNDSLSTAQAQVTSLRSDLTMKESYTRVLSDSSANKLRAAAEAQVSQPQLEKDRLKTVAEDQVNQLRGALHEKEKTGMVIGTLKEALEKYDKEIWEEVDRRLLAACEFPDRENNAKLKDFEDKWAEKCAAHSARQKEEHEKLHEGCSERFIEYKAECDRNLSEKSAAWNASIDRHVGAARKAVSKDIGLKMKESEFNRRKNEYERRIARDDAAAQSWETKKAQDESKIIADRTDLERREKELKDKQELWNRENGIWAQRQAILAEELANFTNAARKKQQATTKATDQLRGEQKDWEDGQEDHQKTIDAYIVAKWKRDDIIKETQQASRARRARYDELRALDSKLTKREVRTQNRLDDAAKIKLEAKKLMREAEQKKAEQDAGPQETPQQKLEKETRLAVLQSHLEAQRRAEARLARHRKAHIPEELAMEEAEATEGTVELDEMMMEILQGM